MINNAPRHLDVIVLLGKSPFEFYLTGSRFFGHADEDSDWDFFVDAHALEGASGLVNWLIHNGFYQESSSLSDYIGSTTGITQIWAHRGTGVHIQIVEDAVTKAQVQDILAKPGTAYQMGTLSKEMRKILWNVALDCFNAGEEKATRLLAETR